ncbi:hypothetical protein HY523_00890 [Candidatus Berkelbacteria bacterium]|nr:hypothetical protein [Candidatus Berkelbacteria bacterium]
MQRFQKVWIGIGGFLLPTVVRAADPLLGATSFGGFVESFYTWGIGAGAALAIIMIIYAGYLMITSVGDPTRTGFAKEIIVGAIAGLLLLGSARLILNLLSAA